MRHAFAEASLAAGMIAALAIALACMAQSQIAGDWQGDARHRWPQLRLALHIASAKDGTLSATLDSVWRPGRRRHPSVTSVTLKDGKLSSLVIDAVHGTYDATVNKDASEIHGRTWSQGQPMELNFKRGTFAEKPAPKPAAATDIDGTWLGTLDTGAIKLRIVFKIVNTTDGLTAQMQSPDQGPSWISASSVTRSGGTLTIEIKTIGGVLEGKITRRTWAPSTAPSRKWAIHCR